MMVANSSNLIITVRPANQRAGPPPPDPAPRSDLPSSEHDEDRYLYTYLLHKLKVPKDKEEIWKDCIILLTITRSWIILTKITIKVEYFIYPAKIIQIN